MACPKLTSEIIAATLTLITAGMWQPKTWDLEASRDFYFDDNGNLLKGSELRDGVTTNYGFGWDIEGETVEVGDLSAVEAGAVDLDGGEFLIRLLQPCSALRLTLMSMSKR